MRPGRRVVQVTVVQSFGSRWLMPRLQSFTAREPEIEVRIDASPILADFTRDPFDLAIREGRGVYPEAESVRLFPLEFVPVASPALARKIKRRNGTIDWAQVRLLHEVSYDYWPDWIAAGGITDVDVARGLFFSHTMLALDAAVEGQGVALAPLCMAQRELHRGVLTIVDPRPYIPGTGIYLAWPRRGLRTLSRGRHGVSRLADRGSADGGNGDVAAGGQGAQTRRSLTALIACRSGFSPTRHSARLEPCLQLIRPCGNSSEGSRDRAGSVTIASSEIATPVGAATAYARPPQNRLRKSHS